MMRGRYAPSPTGQLHLGNARTALLAWLQVRSQGGALVLRLEDLDRQRSSAAAAAALLADLRWLGLDWDEGPDLGGPFASYTQSERLSLYNEALDRLRAEGRLYRCYCTRAELAHLTAAPHAGEEGPVYPGTCRRRAEAEQPARAHAWRFRVPPGETICFDDLLAGRVCQIVADAVGDFVVQRADGALAYQLAVVVDDAAMGMTDVLRGADLISSTPRQLLLYRVLGLTPPRFAHVPLLYGPDGARLSKRHGAVSIASLREAGIAREALTGYLAWLSGLVPHGTAVSPRELVASFNLDRVAREGGVVDPARLVDDLRSW